MITETGGLWPSHVLSGACLNTIRSTAHFRFVTVHVSWAVPEPLSTLVNDNRPYVRSTRKPRHLVRYTNIQYPIVSLYPFSYSTTRTVQTPCPA